MAVAIEIGDCDLDGLVFAGQLNGIGKIARAVIEEVAIGLAALDQDEIAVAIAIQIGRGDAACLGDGTDLARRVEMALTVIEEQEDRQEVTRNGRVQIAIPVQIGERRFITGRTVRPGIAAERKKPMPLLRKISSCWIQ